MFWVSYCTLEDGYRHRLIERARRQRVRLFVSEYILDELSENLIEVLRQTRRFASLASRAIRRLAKVVELPTIIARHVPGDPDDDPIVQTALSAKADFLVTADAEILKVRKFRGVEMLAAARFEAILQATK
jgi:putative PIN family toxin of toxin-antitoxin system